MIHYYLAETDNDYAAAAFLFKEYAASININLDFQHFENELRDLRKMYAAPLGGIILAKYGKEIIGCVAIRKINEHAGELKRMYVQPGHQNNGIGKILLEKALELAKAYNYKVVKLDTLNYMLPAIFLYEQAGFYKTPPYYHNPNETAVYFEKVL